MIGANKSVWRQFVKRNKTPYASQTHRNSPKYSRIVHLEDAVVEYNGKVGGDVFVRHLFDLFRCY